MWCSYGVLCRPGDSAGENASCSVAPCQVWSPLSGPANAWRCKLAVFPRGDRGDPSNKIPELAAYVPSALHWLISWFSFRAQSLSSVAWFVDLGMLGAPASVNLFSLGWLTVLVALTVQPVVLRCPCTRRQIWRGANGPAKMWSAPFQCATT